MRKVLIVVMVVMMTATGLYAQQEGQFTLGARVGGAFGFHDISNPEMSEGGFLPSFNAALYGNYALTNRLSVQLEINFLMNQGLRWSFFDSYEDADYGLVAAMAARMDATFSSLDIPLLFRFSVIQDQAASFGLMAGPHVSIPLGRVQMSTEMSMWDVVDGSESESESRNWDIDTFATFGLTAGFFAAAQVGPGRLIADARLSFDFNSIQAEEGVTFDFMRRRALNFTIGYELSF